MEVQITHSLAGRASDIVLSPKQAMVQAWAVELACIGNKTQSDLPEMASWCWVNIQVEHIKLFALLEQI